MIAGVNGWFAVLSALLVFLPRDARAADDLGGAVRELARKTVAYAGRGEPVSLSWRNVSSLGSADFNQARAAFESALREAGGRASDIAPVAEARFTVSENQTQILIVEEVRKGDERQVWIAGWKRSAAAAPSSARNVAGEEADLGAGRADSGRGAYRRRSAGALALQDSAAHERHDADDRGDGSRAPGRAICADIFG